MLNSEIKADTALMPQQWAASETLITVHSA